MRVEWECHWKWRDDPWQAYEGSPAIAHGQGQEVRARVDGGEWRTPREVRARMRRAFDTALAWVDAGPATGLTRIYDECDVILSDLLDGRER